MLYLDKKKAILVSATEIFGEKGLKDAKVEEIAERAGVAKGTVYLYFKSKQELFQAVLQDYVNNYFVSISEVISGQDFLEVKLLKFINLQLKEISRLARLAFPELYPELMQLDKPLFNEMISIQKRVQRMIAQILEEGLEKGTFREIDTMHAAFCLQGMLRIHLEAAMLERRNELNREEMGNKILDIFLRGIRS